MHVVFDSLSEDVAKPDPTLPELDKVAVADDDCSVCSEIPCLTSTFESTTVEFESLVWEFEEVEFFWLRGFSLKKLLARLILLNCLDFDQSMVEFQIVNKK